MSIPESNLPKFFAFSVFLFLLLGFRSSSAQAAGSISGNVTRSSDAAAIQDVTIQAYDSGWDYVTSAITDISGNYTFPSLEAGDYYLHTSNTFGYIDNFYNSTAGVTHRGAATPVTVVESENTPDIDLILASGAGSISGTIIRDPELTAIEGIIVIAYQQGDNSGNYVAWYETDSLGDYSIPGLAPGNYYLKTFNYSGFVDEYYDNAGSAPYATAVNVAAGTDSSDTDFALLLGGTISGRVTRNSDGMGIAGVKMIAHKNRSWAELFAAQQFNTDADGYYTITGLAAGHYYVSTMDAATLGYHPEWYPISYHEAVSVPVSLATDTPNINFSLPQAGTISGRITRASDGAGITNANLTAFDADWNQYSFATSDASGYYTLPGLEAGFYYVQALTSGYANAYYNNTGIHSAATVVRVTPPADTPNINFSLTANPAGGSVSGTVASQSGQWNLLVATLVRAYDTEWNFINSAPINDSSGAYTIAGLAPGSYYIGTFNSRGHVDEYYDDVTSRGAATPVTVTDGVDTPNINFVLGSGGAIAGTVTRDSDGTGIAGVRIDVYDTDWNLVKTRLTIANGSYLINGLAPGNYYVSTYRNIAFIDGYYNNVTSKNSATQVLVSQGVTSTGIDFGLDSGWALSGPVTNEHDGTPLPGIQVDVYDGSWNLVATGLTDSSGEYYFEGFSPGSYFIKTSGSEGYIDEYYHNVISQGAAFEFVIYDDADKYYRGYELRLTPTAPVLADSDSDRKADISIWRQDSGVWYTLPSDSPGSYTATQWGLPTDIPTPGDYDGDGKMDIAVWRPDSGFWYILPSESPGTYIAIQWGTSGDIPVADDYDGDGKTDPAIYRPGAGVWYILLSNYPGNYSSIQWGMSGDIPVPKDYDGDGKADITIHRPGTGIWYMLPSESPGTYTATQWGSSTDLPVPGDYDRDGKADMAIWRPGSGVWYTLPSGTPGSYISTQWGLATDIPTPGDYDGDGETDIAVWRSGSGAWYTLPSGSPGSYSVVYWGMTGDLPVSEGMGIIQSIP